MTVELNVWTGDESRSWHHFGLKHLVNGSPDKEMLDELLAPYNGWFVYTDESGKVRFNTEQDKLFFMLKWL